MLADSAFDATLLAFKEPVKLSLALSYQLLSHFPACIFCQALVNAWQFLSSWGRESRFFWNRGSVFLIRRLVAPFHAAEVVPLVLTRYFVVPVKQFYVFSEQYTALSSASICIHSAVWISIRTSFVSETDKFGDLHSALFIIVKASRVQGSLLSNLNVSFVIFMMSFVKSILAFAPAPVTAIFVVSTSNLDGLPILPS